MGTSEGATSSLGNAKDLSWSTDGRRPSQLLWVALLVCMLSFFLSYLLGRGSFELHAGAGFAGAFGFVVASASAAIELTRLAIRRALRWPRLLHVAALWVLVFSPFAGILLAFALTEYRNARFVTATEAACQELIRRLEEQRRVIGSYPQDTDSCLVGIPDSSQRDLLAAIQYRRDGRGERYCLWFPDRIENLGGKPSVYLYDSEPAAWFIWNDSGSFDFSFEADLPSQGFRQDRNRR